MLISDYALISDMCLIMCEYSIYVCCRRALEAKAAIYDRLSRGGGLKDEEDEGEEDEGDGDEGDPRYMVDFTKKIWEEVQHCIYMYTCIHV